MRNEQMTREHWEPETYYDEGYLPTPDQIDEEIELLIEEKRLEFYEEWFEYLDDLEWNSIF